MKFARSLAAFLICGSFVVANCNAVEASEITNTTEISAVTDLNTDSIQTDELGFRHNRKYPPPGAFPPPPPPPPPGHYPPPPPPPHHEAYPPPPPGHYPPHPPGHYPPPHGW